MAASAKDLSTWTKSRERFRVCNAGAYTFCSYSATANQSILAGDEAGDSAIRSNGPGILRAEHSNGVETQRPGLPPVRAAIFGDFFSSKADGKKSLAKCNDSGPIATRLHSGELPSLP